MNTMLSSVDTANLGNLLIRVRGHDETVLALGNSWSHQRVVEIGRHSHSRDRKRLEVQSNLADVYKKIS